MYASSWDHGEKLLLSVLKLQLQGGLLAIYSYLVLYYYCYYTTAPRGDALHKGTQGVYTCCIALIYVSQSIQPQFTHFLSNLLEKI